MRKLSGGAFFSALILAHVSQSTAVLISTGSGNPASTPITNLDTGVSSNTLLNAVGQVVEQPSGTPIAGAVYLGNGYVITAAHVGEQSVTFGTGLSAVNYTPVGAATRIGTADLIVYQVKNSSSQFPNVTPLQLTNTAPSINDPVTAIGYGKGASGPVQAEGSYTGYPLSNDQGSHERWGQGVLAEASPGSATGTITITTPIAATSTDIFTTYPSGTGNEFLITPGDSGGALVNPDGTLVGILEVMFTQMNQPANTGVYGDASGAVDLFAYRSQIQAAITPEPASISLLALGALGLLARRRATRA